MCTAALTNPLAHDLDAVAWKGAHEMMEADKALWNSLKFDGLASDGAGGLIEYRRCPRCHSTLARAVTAAEASAQIEHFGGLYHRSMEAILDAAQLVHATHAAKTQELPSR